MTAPPPPAKKAIKGQIRQSKNSKLLNAENANESNKKFQKLGKMLMNVNKATSTFETQNVLNQFGQLGICPRFNVPVRLDFETRKQKEARASTKRGEQSTKQKRNIHDYVKRDSADLNHMVKMMAYAVREHKYFKYTIITVEILHMYLIIAQIYSQKYIPNESISNLHHIVKPVAASVYLMEIAVNWFAGFEVYLNDWFCNLDILSTLPFIISQYLEESWAIFEWLVIFRILRFLFRYVAKTDYTIKVSNQKPNFFQKHVVHLKLVVDTIEKSTQEVLYTLGLLLILFLLFSVAIIELTGKYCDHFSTVRKCIWSFFTAVTMDGWVDIISDLQVQVYPPDLPDFFDKADRVFAYYFGTGIMMMLIVVGGFVFNNLFVAIVVAKLDVSLQQEKKLDSVIDSAQNMFVQKQEEQNEGDEMGIPHMAGMKGDEDGDEPNLAEDFTDLDGVDLGVDNDERIDDIVPILPYKDVKKLYEPLAQLNINNEEITKISIGRVEDFFAMVYALESNLVEYNRLRIRLDEIVATIYKINQTPENHELAMEILGVKNEYRKDRGLVSDSEGSSDSTLYY